MSKGKNGAAAAKRRLAEAEQEITRLRHVLAAEKAGRAASDKEHADEVARLKRDHAAEVAGKAEEFLDVEFEKRVAAEAARRFSAEERRIRREAGEAVSRWLDRSDVRANPRAYTKLAEELGLGRDAGVIYGDHAQNRRVRRKSVSQQNLDHDLKDDPSLVVKR